MPPALVDDPVEALRQPHREDGLRIDSMTGFPRWDGGGFDLGWAIDALRVALSTDSATSVAEMSMSGDPDPFVPMHPSSSADVSAETSPRDRQGRLLLFEFER